MRKLINLRKNGQVSVRWRGRYPLSWEEQHVKKHFRKQITSVRDKDSRRKLKGSNEIVDW